MKQFVFNKDTRSFSDPIKINRSAFWKLSESRKDFKRIKFLDMLLELGFDRDDIKYQIPDVDVTKQIYGDHTEFEFTLKDSWRVFYLYVINHRVICSLFYNSSDTRSRELSKIIKQKEDNGELNMITKIFNEGNLGHMLQYILEDSK